MTFIKIHSKSKQLFIALAMLVLFLMMFANPVSAQVVASTNQNSYYKGDLITLTIETTKNQTAEPDLTPLETNFEIKGSSNNSQISIINGSRSFKKSWKIELQAKTIGQFIIPKIQVGNENY